MLGRKILRIKCFKTLYTYAENQGMTLKEAQSQMIASHEATRDLYLFLLAVTGPLVREASERIEAARGKFNPSEEERNPNMKFTQNSISGMFDADPDFKKILKRRKISWDQYDAFLHKLYGTVRGREYFRKYLESGENSVEEDARLWIRIFEREFEDNNDFAAILEDASIYWNDDLGYALTWCCRSLGEIAKGKRWEMPELYMSDITGSGDDDRDFSAKLLSQAFSAYGRYCDMVAGNALRWDADRICITDLCLIVCGLAEAEAFPTTPVGVIINEYVEMAKAYSTPESRVFVNGLLDKLIKQK